MSLKPDVKCVIWESASAWKRVDMCRAMLAVHGFLTTAESEKVRKRILKWVEKHGKDTE